MTAIDGGSGEVENTAVLVAHVTYGGSTVDVPMRWRGNTNFPADQYLRAPTGNVDRRVDRAGGCIDRRHPVHRDRHGPIRPNGRVHTVSRLPSQLTIVE